MFLLDELHRYNRKFTAVEVFWFLAAHLTGYTVVGLDRTTQ